MPSQLSNVVVSLIVNTNQYTSGLLKAQKDTANAASQMSSSFNNLTEQTKKNKRATDETEKSYRRFRGIVGQAGFQVQDAAVQWQAGTDALVILGQQGSQLAGAFGPTGAVFGAVIALASALGSIFVSSVFDAGEETENLTEKLRDLVEAGTLTADQAAFLAQADRDQIKAKSELRAELLREIGQLERQEALRDRLQTAQSNGERLTVQEREALFELNQVQDESTKTLLALRAQYDYLGQEIEEAQTRINGYSNATEDSIGQSQKQLDAVRDLISQVQEESTLYGKTAREIAIYRAQLNLATEDQIAAINAAYDNIERLETEAEERKELEQQFQADIKAMEAERKKMIQLRNEAALLGTAFESVTLFDESSVDIKGAEELQERLTSRLERIEENRGKKLQSLRLRYSSETLRQTKEYRDLEESINIEADENREQALKESLRRRDELLEKHEERSLKSAEAIAKNAEKAVAIERERGEAIGQIISSTANQYANISQALAGASDEEAAAIKKGFLVEQAGAAAQATISYFAALAANDLAAAEIAAATPGDATAKTAASTIYLATANAKSATTYALSLSGILAATVGGVAAFDVGSENIPNDQLALVHKGERILQPNINKDLTDYLSSNNNGGGSAVNVTQNNTFSGVYDQRQMQNMLSKNSETIAGLVTREERKRPNQRRGR